MLEKSGQSVLEMLRGEIGCSNQANQVLSSDMCAGSKDVLKRVSTELSQRRTSGESARNSRNVTQ
jgi:hypothetical protein